MNLIDLTLTEALAKLRAREITATELTRAYLNRIEKFNDELFCYLTITPQRALADAAESDKRYAAGTARLLEGIPIAMKDNFATRGIRTTAASHILENFVPEYESTVSQKFIDAGAVLLGKTNLSEFGMASTPKTSAFGLTYNPWQRDKKLTPGGSSCGSASAVAGGLALVATGTDTGNSIKFPAALTGLVGFKPTYGVCSRWGCAAFASSLDHPGAFGRTADDCALAMSAMMGFDPLESTAAPVADDIAKSLAEPLAALRLTGLRIGLVREFDSLEISDDIRRTFGERIEQLRAAGAEIVDISLPHINDVLILYLVISRNEASSNLSRYDGMRYGLRVEGRDLDDTYKKTRAAGFGHYVKYRLLTGSVMLTEAFYKDCLLQAAKIRRILDNEFLAAFAKCDLIVSPASPCVAAPLPDDFTPKQFDDADILHIGSNMSGLPAASVPMGLSGGLPIGMHIMGPRFDDKRVLQFAKSIESLANFDNRPSVVMGE
ncbi:MAG: aspartyl/glutamyl-tRNA amidotransferase subunit A [Rickettsiales bacterium]|jgi:aspartyl-tRNA(Asn)/glutamyl-tRNA(Gln) amidotransferase subunit A|nr:aspartyl/glutamyl-tRNA amidotransferase subunit A [Rickettsiales bacterium]